MGGGTMQIIQAENDAYIALKYIKLVKNIENIDKETEHFYKSEIDKIKFNKKIVNLLFEIINVIPYHIYFYRIN